MSKNKKTSTMQISSAFKTLFATGIALLIISCTSDSKKKVKISEVTLRDTIQEERDVEPPPPPTNIPPPKVEMIPTPKECFVNDGLNYRTTITVIFGGDNIIGSITSEELESGTKETSSFEGTRKENELRVKFKEDPPPIGTSSEWIVAPWIIKRVNGKDILQIKFNAKNYETNKWEDTDYQFVLVDCK